VEAQAVVGAAALVFQAAASHFPEAVADEGQGLRQPITERNLK
jgi:hypothetical protein